MLFLSSSAPKSYFYSPVDKIRTPVWGWLLWNTTHPSSVCPSDVCAQHKHFCVRECVCLCGFHCSVQKYWFVFKPQSFYWLTDCSLHVSVCQVFGVSRSMFSSVVNWCHCYLFMLTDSCLDQLNTGHVWWVKIWTVFMVQHHFCFDSLSQSPLPVGEKDKYVAMTQPDCAFHHLHSMSGLSGFIHDEVPLTSLLDSNTQSLINPVFILVNLGRPPTCHPLTGWRLLLPSMVEKGRTSANIFSKLTGPSKFMFPLTSLGFV